MNKKIMDDRPAKDLALSALVLLAELHHIAVNPLQIKHQFDSDGFGLTLPRWLLAAKSLGLHTKKLKKSLPRLAFLNLPVMIWRDDGNHFILARIENGKYLIHDLALDEPQILDEADFNRRYQGEVIAITSRASVLGKLAKFDFTWFIPAIVKYRKILSEVIIVSIVLQIFALITPLFFQVVMDKVLVHQGFSTLNVVAVALGIVVIFEVVLGGIRTYVFAHTTSRIDVELGAKLFRHLLSLPIAYFENRRVGETVARVRELEQIRNFLTGQALTSLLDLLFSFVFLAVMWYYSVWLTLVVIITLLCDMVSLYQPDVTPSFK